MEIAQHNDGNEGRMADLLLTIREVVRRRWLTLTIVTSVVFAIGIALMFLMTPQYEATARVRIDPSQNPLSTNVQADQANLNPEAIETEVTVLSSLDLAREVVRRLKLVSDPEFSKALSALPDAAKLGQVERETIVAQTVLSKISVGRENLTYILAIRGKSSDPVKAARIVNTFADAYLETKAGYKVDTAQKQGTWLQSQLDDLGEQLKQADAAVAAYRARTGISVGPEGSTAGTIVDQQVAPLSSSLAIAESEAAAARANLSAAQQQIASGGLDAVSEVRNSPVIADLRRQRAEVLRTMGEVQARYGEKHPESLRVRDQLTSVDTQIREEANRVIGSLRAEAVAAEARSGSLRRSLGALEAKRAGNTRAAVTADSLERDATAKREAYQRLSEMALNNTQAAQNRSAQAVIVDRAQPPSYPSSPNKPLIAALSLIIGMMAGAGTVAVQEMLGTGMRTIGQLERALGIPVLAAIPNVAKMQNPADLLMERPTSLFAESLRIARASILGVKSGASTQIIALTSALPSEGKTTTALAFARTLATNGSKTLLLECDVRRAAMRALMPDAPSAPGIVEILHGKATVSEGIRQSVIPGLDQLLVTEPYFSSEDMFGGGAMEQILNQLRTQYDHIVLDLPPLVGLADGRFLAVLADVSVLIVRWDSTPASAAAAALNLLRGDAANPVGSIYTMVDASAEAIGGLYYSKKYGTYYQSQ
jgi:polysaccharide biosynthesis transport protein